MEKKYKLTLFVFSLFLVTSPIMASAQIRYASDSVYVTTDKPMYYDGETILVYGEVDNSRVDPVIIIVKSPNGNIVSINQLDIYWDGTFSTEMIAGGPLMGSEGTYTIDANYGNYIPATTTFTFGGSTGTYGGVISTLISQTPLMSLQVTIGSSQDSIQVLPTYTDEYGTELYFIVDGSEEFIEIFIDSQYFTSVKPNQWSDDITIGYGSFDVYATSPEIIITNTGEIYFPATSNGQSINLSTPSSQDSANLIIIGVIVAIVGGVAAAAIATFSIKKKKKSSTIQRTQTDDTQVWR